MSMKQVVVAILDPDGAYDLFKQVVKFINPNAYWGIYDLCCCIYDNNISNNCKI